ncbi:hypothetical protein ACW9H6_14620 [Pseudomonas sp. SDO528_S397]
MLNLVSQQAPAPLLAGPVTPRPVASPVKSAPMVQPAQPVNIPPTSGFTLTEALAHKQNLKTLGHRLGEIAARLGVDANPQTAQAAMASTPMSLHPDSPYLGKTSASTTVEAFIKGLGLPLPSNHFQLDGLAGAMTGNALEHPLGNLGGALSWPLPLSPDEQRQLRLITMSHAHPLGDNPLVMQQKGVLEFLSYQLQLPAETLADPVKTLEALVSTPAAQSMGKALQERMGGIATPSSITDYLLAAITLQMDPESMTTPERNTVAGFDLASRAHWGQPASGVLERLSEHLTTQNKTSPVMAKASAHLLLAGRAPEFLVKDIPANVTYGSPAWVSLTIAARTLEAQSPGKVPNMTFAQVMLEAKSASAANPALTQHIQTHAVLDWGVANGVIEPKHPTRYTADELATLQTTFNARQQQMISASRAYATDLPTRKELALAELKQRFGDLGELFEEKLIWTTSEKRGKSTDAETRLTGSHSMLDLAMMDLPNPGMFRATDSRIPLADLNANPRFGVTQAFDQQWGKAIEDKKAAVSTTIKHLIAQLPLQDRQHFEYGKISFFQQGSHTLGMGFTDKTPRPTGQALLVSIERDGVTTAYEINLSKSSIERIQTSEAREQTSREANRVSTTQAFNPPGIDAHLRMEKRPPSDAPPDSFGSARTQGIADTFVQHLDLDNPTIKEQARGRTTLDEQTGRAKGVEEFLFNLIPFRSAIVNFQRGNYGDGAADLAMDIFGFLTAGAGTAVKLGKVGRSALSVSSKALLATKIIGTATVSAFNPLGGLGDLSVGGVRLIGGGIDFLASKGLEAVNRLRGASGSYDLLKAVSHRHEVAATGTFKVAGRDIDTGAVLKDGQWYAFSPDTGQPYGSALKDFTPTVAAAGGEIKAVTQANTTEWLLSWFATPPNPNFRKDFETARLRALKTDAAGFDLGYSAAHPPQIPGYSSALSAEDIQKLALQSNRTATELGTLVRRIEFLEELPNTFYTRVENVKALDLKGFESGYASANAELIEGFGPSMNTTELQELALVRGRTAQEVGALYRQIEKRAIGHNLSISKKFSDDIKAAGGTVTPMPQGFYLSQVSPISGGQCAALANTMAYAVQEGREATLIENFFTAMAYPDHINTQNFRNKLQGFQSRLRHDFFAGERARRLTATDIIAELANATASKSLLIGNAKHGISAGVTVNGDTKHWFYYDPNLGLAKFSSEAAMREGLTRALSTGSTSHLFRPDPTDLTYGVADFNELRLLAVVGSIQDAVSLFRAPIVIPRPALQKV